MKTSKKNNPFLKVSNISIGLATFLVVGLGGCDGSNDSLATKQQKCKLDSYKEQHPEECEYIKNVYGNTNINSTNNNTHNTNTSWIPMWMMLHTMNNAHGGYSYSSNGGSKSSSYFSTGGSHSSGSSSGG